MHTFDAYSDTLISNIPELQPKNLWGMSFMNSGSSSNDFPNHDFLIQSTNLPLFSLNIEKTDFDLILPEGKENYGSVTFSFYETVGFQGFNYCYDWLTSVYDFNKRLYKKGFQYKKRNAIIQFLKIFPSGNDPLMPKLPFNSVKNYEIMKTGKFILQGMMIKGISDVSLDEDGDPLTFEVEMEIQNVKYERGMTRIG